MLELADERGRIEHDAIGDDAQRFRMEDTGGDKMELVLLIVDHNRVTGVRAAAPADDDVFVVSEIVDELSLGLIAPHRAHNDRICNLTMPLYSNSRDHAAY
jgi:hypothetical protein